MKKYGISMTLPEGDPMRAAHLLGEDWESFRWYDSQQERDQALADLQSKHPYYRIGDFASLNCTPVERDEEPV